MEVFFTKRRTFTEVYCPSWVNLSYNKSHAFWWDINIQNVPGIISYALYIILFTVYHITARYILPFN